LGTELDSSDRELLSQAVSMPPQDPKALERTKDDMFRGRKVVALKIEQSVSFVSCRQIIVGVACLSTSRTMVHLFGSPSPHTFHDSNKKILDAEFITS
jgi:hypothetical protein